MISTSLENRLVIRPRGVVSKKLIGARKTRVMALFSITLLDRVPRTDRTTEKANIKNAWMTPKPAYAPMYWPAANPNLLEVHQESHKLVTILAP